MNSNDLIGLKVLDFEYIDGEQFIAPIAEAEKKLEEFFGEVPRYWLPGTRFTMNYLASRPNVRISGEGVIEAVFYG